MTVLVVGGGRISVADHRAIQSGGLGIAVQDGDAVVDGERSTIRDGIPGIASRVLPIATRFCGSLVRSSVQDGLGPGIDVERALAMGQVIDDSAADSVVDGQLPAIADGYGVTGIGGRIDEPMPGQVQLHLGRDLERGRQLDILVHHQLPFGQTLQELFCGHLDRFGPLGIGCGDGQHRQRCEQDDCDGQDARLHLIAHSFTPPSLRSNPPIQRPWSPPPLQSASENPMPLQNYA